MDPSWILDEAFSAHLGTSWFLCGINLDPEKARGPSLERIGSLVDPCWVRLGPILEPNWFLIQYRVLVLGPSWTHLGTIVVSRGQVLDPRGPDWALLELSGSPRN